MNELQFVLAVQSSLPQIVGGLNVSWGVFPIHKEKPPVGNELIVQQTGNCIETVAKTNTRHVSIFSPIPFAVDDAGLSRVCNAEKERRNAPKFLGQSLFKRLR